jgi:hypothetical protein
MASSAGLAGRWCGCARTCAVENISPAIAHVTTVGASMRGKQSSRRTTKTRL